MFGKVIHSSEGKVVLGGFVIFKLDSGMTNGSLAIVEHHLVPGQVGAVPHTHQHEDEISYIVEGKVTVKLGERVFEAGPGTLVLKPRGEQHAFWNQGNVPARLIEIITPGGFEDYFAELDDVVSKPPLDLDQIIALGQKYGIDLDFSQVEQLTRKYGLQLPGSSQQPEE
jgi:mannose-6-phosphate isomerase-like protein (cupin superfamily)